MQDNKALQAGTSHNLGQNFAKAFDLTFQTESGEQEFAWNTSWGVSTRMVGGLVMTHGDDNGLRVAAAARADRAGDRADLPKTDEERAAVLEGEAASRDVAGRAGSGADTSGIRVHVDDRDGIKPGAKYYEWELRGIPLRLELGPRDLAANQGVLVRRDTREKRPVSLRHARRGRERVILERIQDDMLRGARAARGEQRARAHHVRSLPRAHGREGGFVYAGWCGSAAVRGADQGRDEGDDPRASRRGVPFGRGADDVPEVRRAGDRRGVWAQGVLTCGRFVRAPTTDSSRGVPREGACCAATGALPSCERVGTPCYVYSATRFARATSGCRCASRRAASHSLHAQGQLEPRRACASLRELGAGVDVVSGGELYRALRPGSRGADIVFGGVGKTERELERGARGRQVLLINAESEAELRHDRCRLAGERGVVAPVALRVNPEVTVDTPHAYIKTGEKGHKFGIPSDDVRASPRVAASLPNVGADGLDMHIGSQLAALDPYRDGAAAAARASLRACERRDHDARVSRHRRRAWRSVRRRAKPPPTSSASRAAREGRGADTGCAAHGAGALHRRQRRRAAHAGAVSQAQRRARISSSPTPG